MTERDSLWWLTALSEAGSVNEEVLTGMQAYYGEQVDLAKLGVKLGMPYTSFLLIRQLNPTVADVDQVLQGKS